MREISDILKTNLKSYIPIGQKIEVEVKEGNYRGFYLSRIEDVTDVIKIALPTDEEGRYAILANMTPIFVSYFLGDKRLGFNSINIEKITENHLKLLVISFPDEIFRIEKREFFRVEVNVPSVLLYEEQEIKCLIVDISGGGVLIRTDVELKTGGIVKIFIATVESNLEIRIVRRIKTDDARRFEYGAKFVHIKEKLRDKIIGYCFSESIKQKKLVGDTD